MNLNDLKELNITALNSLNEYNKEYLSGNTNKETIKNYYTAKHLSTEIEAYNKVFEINALELADEIKDFLKEKTGNDYILDVLLDKKERSELKDEFGTKHIEKYNYSLVLKNANTQFDFDFDKFESSEIIPVANNQSSIVSTNTNNLNFDKTEAMQSFAHKTVNLIGFNPIYIPNYNNPAPCPAVQKYEMQDFLWEIVAKQVEKKKIAEVNKIKSEIAHLKNQQKVIMQEDIDYIIK